MCASSSVSKIRMPQKLTTNLGKQKMTTGADVELQLKGNKWGSKIKDQAGDTKSHSPVKYQNK
jgi:hypothetical protein